MKFGAFGRKGAKPSMAQEVKGVVKNSDKAIILTVKAGQVDIFVIKNVKYKYEVEGILTEALRLYTINPIIGAISRMLGTVKTVTKPIIIPTAKKEEPKKEEEK